MEKKTDKYIAENNLKLLTKYYELFKFVKNGSRAHYSLTNEAGLLNTERI